MGHFFLNIQKKAFNHTYQNKTTRNNNRAKQTNKKKGKETTCSLSFSGFLSQCKARGATVVNAARK